MSKKHYICSITHTFTYKVEANDATEAAEMANDEHTQNVIYGVEEFGSGYEMDPGDFSVRCTEDSKRRS